MIRIKKGDIMIGALNVPDRKKPVIGIMCGVETFCYGSFYSKEAADEFMAFLVEFFMDVKLKEAEKE